MRYIAPLLLSLTAAASPLAAQETLKFHDKAKNPNLEGEVVSLSYKTVEIVTGGVKQSVEAWQVAEIVTTRKTPDFLKGEEAMANGDPASAMQRFEKVVTDARATEHLRQLAALQVVRCHAAGNNPAGVVQAAQVLRARKADSFFIRESYEYEVKSHLGLGNGAGAAAAINAFEALGTTVVTPTWAKWAYLLKSALAESQNDWKGALTMHRAFLRDPLVGDDAALGELRCLTAQADWRGLGTAADGHLKNAMGQRNFNPRLLIASYTGKGDVEMNGGKSKEALLDYLQGAMVIGKGEASPEHEAALARGAIACASMAAAEKDPAKKTRQTSQARELQTDLLRTYPGSKYKAEVDKALRSLR